MSRAARRALIEAALGPEVSSKQLRYEEWLRDQPPVWQDRILGRDRAEKFRAGELRIDRYTDPPSDYFSLADLAAGADVGRTDD